MPRMLERFTAESVRQEIGGRRAEAGDFGGEVAQSLQGLGSIASRAGGAMAEQVEEDDARGTLVAIAKHRAEFAKEADDALSDGRDLAELQEKFESKLAEIRANAVTRKGVAFADQHGSVSRQSFQEQVRQISARRYGAALTTDVNAVLSSASESLQRSPELMPFFRDSVNALFKQFEGKGLPPDVLARAREQAEDRLMYTAGHARIEQNPHTALQELQEGGFEGMKPEHRAALINKAQVDIRAIEANRDLKVREADRLQKATDNAALGKVIADWGEEKPIDVRALAKMENVSGAMREHMVNLVKRWTKEPKEKTDHTAAQDVYNRIHLPEGTPNRIETPEQLNALLFEGKVSWKEHPFLKNTLANREKPYEKAIAKVVSEGARAIMVRDQLNRPPPYGLQAVTEWRNDVAETIKTARAAGEKISDYVDETNSKYIGKLLAPHVESARQRVSREAQAVRDAATAEAAPKPAAPTVAPQGRRPPPSVPGLSVMGERDGRWIYRIDDKSEFDKVPPGMIGRLPNGEERVRQ